MKKETYIILTAIQIKNKCKNIHTNDAMIGKIMVRLLS